MNNAVTIHENAPLTADTIRDNVNLVQKVMKGVMKEGTHYGQIPGTPKPSLWKPGAEVLASTFRIAVSYKTEELSTPDVVRYRITAVGVHQTSGIVMGEGMGECSSNEEKYKWRKTFDAEYESAPEHLRRIKYTLKNGRVEQVKQVRTEPADLANTILKMACKRAQVAMILNVTAASDIFTQDIEDLPPELREQDTGNDKTPVAPAQLPDGYDEFVVEFNEKLVEAAEHGTEALSRMFNSIPQSRKKTAYWRINGDDLKEVAAEADKQSGWPPTNP